MGGDQDNSIYLSGYKVFDIVQLFGFVVLCRAKHYIVCLLMGNVFHTFGDFHIP